VDEIKIKGAVIKDPRDWMRSSAYGPEAYQAALATLSPDEQALIDGPMLPSTWYPIAVWDRFQQAMRAQAHQRRGHSAEQFNMRNMRESGPAIIRGVYKFFLGLLNPTTVITQGMVIFGRSYSEGHFEVVENVMGHAVVRSRDARPGLRTNLLNNMGSCLVFLLELNGVHDPRFTITRDEVVDGKLVFELTLNYQLEQGLKQKAG
jgi:hypothetical protein